MTAVRRLRPYQTPSPLLALQRSGIRGASTDDRVLSGGRPVFKPYGESGSCAPQHERGAQLASSGYGTLRCGQPCRCPSRDSTSCTSGHYRTGMGHSARPSCEQPCRPAENLVLAEPAGVPACPSSPRPFRHSGPRETTGTHQSEPLSISDPCTVRTIGEPPLCTSGAHNRTATGRGRRGLDPHCSGWSGRPPPRQTRPSSRGDDDRSSLRRR